MCELSRLAAVWSELSLLASPPNCVLAFASARDGAESKSYIQKRPPEGSRSFYLRRPSFAIRSR
ncbi:hypothetical protein SPHINGOT1_120198 [Sphingomonas sp. T1]|nr:hypothetical protein SPHINGOT1_120198 [Sphingomonas sp. T1]